MSDDKTKIMHKEPKTQRMPPRDEERNPSPPKEGNIKSGTLFYGYEVGERLSANSGEAEIYFAIKNNKKYIIKHYYPKFRPKYEILEKLKGINHPDIINLHEYGNHEGRFYEIMDFAKGGSLSDKTKEGKFKYLPMDEDTVLQVIKETINALKFCHTNGIIHRDIKPGNLFYKNEDGTDILVGDFGISSELDLEGNMSKRMTSTSRTEGYAAPEIYSGVIGKEIDYYALGITIFELLTAKLYQEGIRLVELYDLSKDQIPEVEKVEPEVILRVICLIRDLEPSRSNILNLDSHNFTRDWNAACEGFKDAYHRLTSVYGVYDFDKLIPFNSMIIPLSSILNYIRIQNLHNDLEIYKKIDKWYWISIFSERYTQSTNTVSFSDFKAMKDYLIENNEPDFISRFSTNDLQLDVDSKGSAIYKGIFCLLSLKGVRDFE
ncbi:MAG: hypothetical protein EBS19_13120, partial [Spirochaetia bacterium]|nr:hypothetical protein [Spirochaetia bacterium]